MKVQYDNIEIFNRNGATLKETSWDKDGENPGYMTDSEIHVINFDKVKKSYIKDMGLSCTPCSNDALYIGEDEKAYFIEFKNGLVDNKTVYNIYNKIYDSLLIFNDIIQENISFCRENVNFILVYNEGRNSRNEKETKYGDSSKAKISKHFYAKAKRKYVRFGLERFEKLYFQDVFTYTEKEFENNFLASIN